MLIKRTNYDYIVSRLQGIIQERGTWKDMYAATTGSTLIELIAYAVDNLSYYLERRVQELYLHSCRLESSIYHLASLLGYLPIRKYAASGTAVIRLSKPIGAGITVPVDRGTTFSIGNISYTIMESGTIPATAGLSGYPEVQLTVMQGILQIEDFPVDTSKELENVELATKFSSISENFLRVLVPAAYSLDGVVKEYYYATIPRPTWRQERYYALRYYFDKLRIDFGTDGFGWNPIQDMLESGQPIQVQYMETDGKKGNTVSEITGLHFDERLYDSRGIEDEYEVGTENYEIILSPMTGGVDQETMDSVKLYAPRLYSTGKRAVTRLDYRYWLERHPLVAKANAWGEQEFVTSGGLPSETPADVRNAACYTVLKTGESSSYAITEADSTLKKFVVGGANLPLNPGDSIVVERSPDNDGVYTVLCEATAIVTVGNYTTIYVVEPIPASTAGGVVTCTPALEALSEEERSLVEEYISAYMAMTVYLKYYKPVLIPIDLEIYIKPREGRSVSTVSEEIRRDLFNYFTSEFFDFEQTVYKSYFHDRVLTHESVLACSIDWLINCLEVDDDFYTVQSYYSSCIEDHTGESFFERYRSLPILRNITIFDSSEKEERTGRYYIIA
jgi:hypothetical protein